MDKTMDTEAGGEQTQYESIKTETVAPEKQSGQLGAGQSNTESPTSAPKDDKSEKTADNIRYGQNISESGMGGMTNSTGSAGGQQAESDAASRSAQGYGAGNNVGG